MRIISAARRTGKDEYVKCLVSHRNFTYVLLPDQPMANDYNKGQFIERGMSVQRFTGIPRDLKSIYRLVLMEPALYPNGVFKSIIDTVPEENILLVIGTPVGYEDDFSRFLQDNKSRVTIWSHCADIDLDSDKLQEYTGEFLL